MLRKWAPRPGKRKRVTKMSPAPVWIVGTFSTDVLVAATQKRGIVGKKPTGRLLSGRAAAAGSRSLRIGNNWKKMLANRKKTRPRPCIYTWPCSCFCCLFESVVFLILLLYPLLSSPLTFFIISLLAFNLLSSSSEITAYKQTPHDYRVGNI